MLDRKDRIEHTKETFLNNLWNVQKIVGEYVIFCKPSIFLGDKLGTEDDEYIIWNSEFDFSSYHSHMINYSEALDVVYNINSDKLCNINEYYKIQSTLRVLPMNSDLWYKYINIIVQNNIIIRDISKWFNNKEYKIRFNNWYPCPSCGYAKYDYIEEIKTRCCQKCGNIY